jgi:serine protease Do
MTGLRRSGLVAVAGALWVARIAAPSAHGQLASQGTALVDTDPAQDRSPERRVRQLAVLGGSGATLGVRVSDAAAGGARIDEVQPGSPADKGGLKRDDVVVEFDGERVRGERQFARLVEETPIGRTVKATVIRDGQRRDLQLTPGESRAMSALGADRVRPFAPQGDRWLRGNLGGYVMPFDWSVDIPGQPRLGVTVDELTSQLAEHFGTKDGVLVTSVADGSAAARAGVKAGDVITAVNGHHVASREDLLSRVRESGDEVKLGLVRDKKELTLTAKIEPRRAPRSGRPI